MEDDIDFIGELYGRLNTASIDVLEGGGLLDMGVDDTLKNIQAMKVVLDTIRSKCI